MRVTFPIRTEDVEPELAIGHHELRCQQLDHLVQALVLGVLAGCRGPSSEGPNRHVGQLQEAVEGCVGLEKARVRAAPSQRRDALVPVALPIQPVVLGVRGCLKPTNGPMQALVASVLGSDPPCRWDAINDDLGLPDLGLLVGNARDSRDRPPEASCGSSVTWPTRCSRCSPRSIPRART